MEAGSTQDMEAKAYPRTYGLSVASKWMVSALGLVIFSLSLAGGIFFLLSDNGRAPLESSELPSKNGPQQSIRSSSGALLS